MNLCVFRLPPRAGAAAEAENARHERLVAGVHGEGRFAMSVYRRAGVTWLRAVFVNPASRREDVRAFADALHRLAAREVDDDVS